MQVLRVVNTMPNASWLCEPLSPHAQVQGYRTAFPFELWVKVSWKMWWQNNWTLCFWITGFYLAGVIVGQRLMRDRTAFRLRRPLLAWNLLIATYSLLTGIRVTTEILVHVRREGFLASLCELGPLEHQKLLGSYVILFAITKVVELGDTAFLILRRKPVTFMHCFHHAIVLVATWPYTAYPSVVGVYFMAMNQAVHFLHYSYLSLKMLRVRMPAVMVRILMALELLQVVVGFGLTAYAARAKRTGVSCCLYAETIDPIKVAYVAFAVVFLKIVVVDVVFHQRTGPKTKSD